MFGMRPISGARIFTPGYLSRQDTCHAGILVTPGYLSRQDLVDDLAMNVCQAEVPTLVFER